MSDELEVRKGMPLHGKKGLIAGIANKHSIAYGCAKALRDAGADLAITYLNAKAEPYVRPLAEELKSPIIVACDVRQPGQLEAVFARIRNEWGRLDFLLHSIAYAPKEDLHSRITDCSQAGFALAMDVSCHSFIRMARLAEPLMSEGDACSRSPSTVRKRSSKTTISWVQSKPRWRLPSGTLPRSLGRNASAFMRFLRAR